MILGCCTFADAASAIILIVAQCRYCRLSGRTVDTTPGSSGARRRRALYRSLKLATVQELSNSTECSRNTQLELQSRGSLGVDAPVIPALSQAELPVSGRLRQPEWLQFHRSSALLSSALTINTPCWQGLSPSASPEPSLALFLSPSSCFARFTGQGFIDF